jgi:hypothetical protein
MTLPITLLRVAALTAALISAYAAHGTGSAQDNATATERRSGLELTNPQLVTGDGQQAEMSPSTHNAPELETE